MRLIFPPFVLPQPEEMCACRPAAHSFAESMLMAEGAAGALVSLFMLITFWSHSCGETTASVVAPPVASAFKRGAPPVLATLAYTLRGVRTDSCRLMVPPSVP
jgi:hypothetical protein